jgi:hypothetical protein
MSIQRVPETPFAQISNEALRDSRLSYKARGLLSMVLSHTGEWEASRKWLEGQSEVDGRASIQTALNELTVFGYRIVSKEVIKGEIRTIVEWRHTPKEPISRPTENLTVRNPDRQKTGRSLEYYPSEHYLKEHYEEQNVIALKPSFFDMFWQVYPRKAGKQAAMKAFSKACELVEASVIVEAAQCFRDDPNRTDEFTPHPTTWLNQGRWDDEPLPAKSGSGTRAYLEASEALSGANVYLELGAANEPF